VKPAKGHLSPVCAQELLVFKTARRQSSSLLAFIVTMGNDPGGRRPSLTQEMIEKDVGKLQLSGRYHRLPKKLEDDYEVTQKVLGSGYNGAVRMGVRKLHASGEQKVAVKAFKLANVHGDKKAQLESEVEIFLAMDHPHITRLFDVYETKANLFLVMECMEGGELFDRVAEVKRFAEKDAADAIWQMLLAINYLHSHGMVHRDVKLENFLYDAKGSNHLKLIDFGFSKVWTPNTKMQASCGTLSYVAPEVIAQRYGPKCDLWSLGVIAFILLAGYMPFHGSEEEQTKKITEGKYKIKEDKWKNVSEQGLNFVKSLLQVDPEKRPSAEQALQDNWITTRHHLTPEVDESIVNALREFGHATKFKRCCMEMLAWSLSNEERAQVREYFVSMDEKGVGTISLTELKHVLVDKFHITCEETSEIFHAMDFHHDDAIHYTDFLAAMVSTRIALHDDLLHMAFNKFDTHNSGYITKEDLREVLGANFEGEHVEDLMKEAELSEHGKISYADFVSYIKGSHGHKHQDAAEKVVDNMLKDGHTGEYAKGKEHKIARKQEGNDSGKATDGDGKQPKCGCTIL